jgi:hypothetical protein
VVSSNAKVPSNTTDRLGLTAKLFLLGAAIAARKTWIILLACPMRQKCKSDLCSKPETQNLSSFTTLSVQDAGTKGIHDAWMC